MRPRVVAMILALVSGLVTLVVLWGVLSAGATTEAMADHRSWLMVSSSWVLIERVPVSDRLVWRR